MSLSTPETIHGARRSPLGRLQREFGASLLAVLAALVVGALIIAAWGVNPATAYLMLLDGAFGNLNSLAETLLRAIPLTFTGLSVAIAFRGGAFNVGAEGQLFLGGVAAAAVGLQFGFLPQPLLILAMIVAAAIAGAVWAGIAGLLKIRFGASELITTIMLSYVGIYLASWLLHGPIQEAAGYLPQTERLPRSASLWPLIPGTRLHSGFLIAVAIVVLMHWLLWRTVWGYRLRARGLNPRAALAAGMKVGPLGMSAFLVSGALAGIAGYMEVVGVQHRMIENLSPGYGYTGIIVALLGQTNPFGVLASAILFAALQVGATTMESAAGVPSTVTTIIQGLVVLFLIGRSAFRLARIKPQAGA